MVQMSKPIVVV